MMIYKKHILCKTEEETKNLAFKFAEKAKKGDIFALFGTLGAGKSTFSRYFIKKLTNANEVPSPTFTLVQTYDTEKFEIYHYDMYRLKKAEEAYELDIEEAFYNAVSLIEWPDKIVSILPKNIWKITISTKENMRIFDIETNDEDKKERMKDF